MLFLLLFLVFVDAFCISNRGIKVIFFSADTEITVGPFVWTLRIRSSIFKWSSFLNDQFSVICSDISADLQEKRHFIYIMNISYITINGILNLINIFWSCLCIMFRTLRSPERGEKSVLLSAAYLVWSKSKYHLEILPTHDGIGLMCTRCIKLCSCLIKINNSVFCSWGLTCTGWRGRAASTVPWGAPVPLTTVSSVFQPDKLWSVIEAAGDLWHQAWI